MNRIDKQIEGTPVVLVTGASSGIGRELVKQLTADGYRVFGTSRRPKAGDDLLELDVRSEHSARSVVAEVVRRAGRIDGLVNNAGLTAVGAVEDMRPEQIQNQVETNLLGVDRMVRAALPYMRRQRSGRIVNLSSVLGVAGAPFSAHYSATKFAVEGYSEALHYELSPFNIHVAIVEPTFTRTGLGKHSVSGGAPVAEYEPWRAAASASVNRMIETGQAPEVVARTVVRALQTRRPRLRYPAGRQAWLGMSLRRWLPFGAFESVFRRMFGLDRVTETAHRARGGGVTIRAEDWFSKGERVLYDPGTREIVEPGEAAPANAVAVWQRVIGAAAPGQTWITFMPGFPDGSYGWSRVEAELSDPRLSPRLYYDYVGQGDSDKPADYPYSSVERADLVEALWRYHGIESTSVVTFDYSSLAVLELLSRRLDRMETGIEPGTRILKAVLANGGLFADSHSHPWFTTPLLKTPIGRVGTWFAQRSRRVFNEIAKTLWPPDYEVPAEELEQLYQAITRRNGAAFMSLAAGFVDEHKRNAERWDFGRLFHAFKDTIDFHVVGSERDVYEPRQVVSARDRLGEHGLDVSYLPGGHLTTSEHPRLLAELITELAPESTLASGETVRVPGLVAV